MCDKVTRVKVVDDFEGHGDGDEERERRRGGSSTATREHFGFSMLFVRREKRRPWLTVGSGTKRLRPSA
jgi:hypothetical protein